MKSELIETLSSFVPPLVIRRLVTDPSPISEPTAEMCSAAVLFADITDFTAIADNMSRAGLQGSEDIAMILNHYFSRLIDLIHYHGGEVTKFAGDALIALWPISSNVARRGPEAQTMLALNSKRAAQCALTIQNTFKTYRRQDRLRLSLQIGIGAGDVYTVHLGGVFNRWEFLLSGSPLVQMSLAKEQAKPGQVVVSPELWSLIADTGAGRPLADGFVELRELSNPPPPEQLITPHLSAEAAQGLRSYIPAAVYSHLLAGHEQWLSELRRVSVLFIKLPRYGTSIKHPYTTTLPQAQGVMRAMQTALYRYAGSINKFNVDDKGITLVAALGLPPLSHSDDATRAVHVAIDMQRALDELGRQSAIGITTGWAFCGPIGNRSRREYTMVGNTVNMAARLMQTADIKMSQTGAKSFVLCDEATYRAVQADAEAGNQLANSLTFKQHPYLGIKGIHTPVTAFEPAKLSRIPYLVNKHSSIRTVGQGQERSVLDKHLRDFARDSNPSVRVVILESEPGTGKSRLIEHARQVARQLGIRAFESSANILQQTTPYYAWQPIFRELFQINVFEDGKKLRSQVLSQLPAIRGERGFPDLALRLAPLLNSVLPLSMPDSSTTKKMSAGQRRRTTNLFLMRLLQRKMLGPRNQKPHPTAIIMENGQWLDDGSWDLILSLSSLKQPLFLLIETRPLKERALGNPLAESCQKILTSEQVKWVKLSLLNKHETRELICQQLRVTSIPEQVVDLAHAMAGGHPKFTMDLVNAWQAADYLRKDRDNGYIIGVIDALSKLPLPESIRSATTARLERLKPDQQLILKVASVFENSFTVADLSQIYPLEVRREELAALLNSLVELDILESDASKYGQTYRFKYRLIRDSAFSMLLLSQRKTLLDRAATIYDNREEIARTNT